MQHHGYSTQILACNLEEQENIPTIPQTCQVLHLQIEDKKPYSCT